jgi:hypothetical protein
MRVLMLSRVVAILAGLTVAGACTDSTDTSPINALPGPIDGVLLLSPTSATISAGQTVVLRAQVLDRLGMPMSDVPITWRSHNDAVASVSDGGEVHGKAEGHAVIIASARGTSRTATIHVLPTPQQPKQELKPNMDPGRTAQ